MALAQEKVYTVEDIYNLPDGERAELIDGRMYMLATPNTRHQEILGTLFAAIFAHIKEQGGKCRVFPAPFAVFLDDSGKNYVEPDISVICDPSKLNEKGCNGAPDWVIEIVSPSSRRMDYFLKLFKYRTAGVREYWIIDAEKDVVMVYNFDKEEGGSYTFSEDVKSGVIEGLEINFTEI